MIALFLSPPPSPSLTTTSSIRAQIVKASPFMAPLLLGAEWAGLLDPLDADEATNNGSEVTPWKTSIDALNVVCQKQQAEITESLRQMLGSLKRRHGSLLNTLTAMFVDVKDVLHLEFQEYTSKSDHLTETLLLGLQRTCRSACDTLMEMFRRTWDRQHERFSAKVVYLRDEFTAALRKCRTGHEVELDNLRRQYNDKNLSQQKQIEQHMKRLFDARLQQLTDEASAREQALRDELWKIKMGPAVRSTESQTESDMETMMRELEERVAEMEAAVQQKDDAIKKFRAGWWFLRDGGQRG